MVTFVNYCIEKEAKLETIQYPKGVYKPLRINSKYKVSSQEFSSNLRDTDIHSSELTP